MLLRSAAGASGDAPKFSFSAPAAAEKKEDGAADGAEKKEDAGAAGEEEEGKLADVEDDGQTFEPIVKLTEKVDAKTGEEAEEELLNLRAKLFRMVDNEWKERGLGPVRLLKHKESGKIRLVMRRENTLKVCANHYLNKAMELKKNVASEKSWIWKARDFADEEVKEEVLAIRFGTPEIALQFKEAFEKAQASLPEKKE